jgi:DNA-directed RNA polymerase specialized sigma24 family protein
MQQRSAWTLTSSALEKLLRTLDSDRDRAAVAYEALRERVAGLFEWWRAAHPRELADETLDRVARKIDEGAAIAPGSLGAYVRGVARMVFYESRRDPVEVEAGDAIPVEPADDDPESALSCLDDCLATLAKDERTLVLRYYESGKRADVRQRLARETGLSMTALRIRTHRLRNKLEECVTGCLARR